MGNYIANKGSPLDLLETEYARLSPTQIVDIGEQSPEVMRNVCAILRTLMHEGVEDANGYPVERVLEQFRVAISELMVTA